jgi:hypothetical protein
VNAPTFNSFSENSMDHRQILAIKHKLAKTAQSCNNHGGFDKNTKINHSQGSTQK